MSESSVKITGLKELSDSLTKMKNDVAIKHVRGALAAGAAVIRDAARQNAPQMTGKLRRAIYSMWMRELSDSERQTFFVSVRRGKKFRSRTLTVKGGKTRTTKDTDAYYWTWIEFGHTTRQSGGRIKGGSARREQTRAGAKAKGAFVPPQPFLRPAFESHKYAAVAAFYAELVKRIFIENLKKGA